MTARARLSATRSISPMAIASDGLAADHQCRHRSGCEGLDVLETEPAKPLLDLRHLPWIAAAAHGPKRPQRFPERIGLRWKHAEHQPAAWNERAIGVLHGRRRDLQGKERCRIPNDSERFLVVEIDDALCAQSDSLPHIGCGDVGARKLQ